MNTAPTKIIAAPMLLALNRCAHICLERQHGCTHAAADVSDRGLKQLLGDFAEERGVEAQALLSMADPLGGAFLPQIPMRRWLGPGARTDRRVLDHCIRGDEISLVEFKLIFAWAPLAAMPMEVRALMLSAYGATLRLLSELRRRLEPASLSLDLAAR